MPLDTPAELERLGTREAAVDTQQQAVTQTMEKSAVGREAETTPLLKQVGDIQGEQSQFLERRQAGMPQIPEFKPQPPISSKEFEGLSFALIGMAMVGGLASRGNWLGASYALNGAMRGFLEGNQLLAQKNYRDYNEKFKAAVAKENAYIRETDEVLRAKNLSINQKLTQVRIIAAKYDKQDMLAQSRLKSLDGIRRSIESQRTAVLRIQEHYDEVAMRVQAYRDAAEQREQFRRDSLDERRREFDEREFRLSADGQKLAKEYDGKARTLHQKYLTNWNKASDERKAELTEQYNDELGMLQSGFRGRGLDLPEQPPPAPTTKPGRFWGTNKLPPKASSAPVQPGAGAPAKPAGAAPTAPQGVPPESLYSPSRKMWKAPDGTLYDESGAKVS